MVVRPRVRQHAAVAPRHRRRLVQRRRGQPLLLVALGPEPAAAAAAVGHSAAVGRSAAAVAGVRVAALGVGRRHVGMCEGAARMHLLQEAVDVRRLPPLGAGAGVG